MKKCKSWFSAGLTTAAMLAAPALSAQGVSLPDRFSYAAKFVCGTSLTPTTSPPMEPAVKPGNYATAVNIHNPWPTTVLVTKQVVIAEAERYPDTRFIPPTSRVTDKVPPGSAMYVDCDEIVRLAQLSKTPIPGAFIEGFVVVDSYFPAAPGGSPTPADLDVVTVTTAAPPANSASGSSGYVSSHEITPVAGRRLPKGTWPF